MPLKSLRALGIAACLLVAAATAQADVTLPEIFGDHMVLQQQKDLPVWGWAQPSESVTITAGPSKATVTADKDGKWMAKLAPLPANNQPIEVTIAGKNTIVLHDVLVGDVWICSGQSNMEFGINGDASSVTEIPKADVPSIRIFFVTKQPAPTPQEHIPQPEPAPAPMPKPEWVVCTPKSVIAHGSWAGFSAVGYYFGREIQEFTHQPVGLIGTYWGGTPAQAWTSLPTLEATPELNEFARKAIKFRDTFETADKRYQEAKAAFPEATRKWEEETKAAQAAYDIKYKEWQTHASDVNAKDLELETPVKPVPKPAPTRPVNPRSPGVPTMLYNGMIAPLVPFAIKGAIWYQGEANAGNPVQYRTLFPAMITDWRKNFNQGDFPFFFVQLANFMAVKPLPGESNWAGLREAQLRTLKLPNTGMAVIIDIGEASDIHPKDKWDVGHRLALGAKHVAYGQDLVYSGPMYKSFKIEGDKIRIAFDDIGSGLVIGQTPEHFHPGQPKTTDAKLTGFAVAGADHQFVWADAVIDGDSVIVSSPNVSAPIQVRYGWADNPTVNLYNKEGLPASPFRTDDLPIFIPPSAPEPKN